MTALNLIVQPASQSAFIITDTAVFVQGRVVAFRPKRRNFQLRDGSSAVLACGGIVGISDFAKFSDEVRQANASEFKNHLTAAFRAIEQRLHEEGKPEAVGHCRMAAVVAMFEPGIGASGYLISNVLNQQGAPGYRVNTLMNVKKSLTEYTGEPVPFGVDVTNARRWNPYVDGITLLEAQRADLFDGPSGSYVGVGGSGVVSRIDAHGITEQTIISWSDKQGRPISLDRYPTGILTEIRRRSQVWLDRRHRRSG